MLSCPLSSPSVGHIHLEGAQRFLKINCIPGSNYPTTHRRLARTREAGFPVPNLLSSTPDPCSPRTAHRSQLSPILPFLSPFALSHLYNPYSEHNDEHNVLDAIPPVSTLNTFLSCLISLLLMPSTTRSNRNLGTRQSRRSKKTALRLHLSTDSVTETDRPATPQPASRSSVRPSSSP